MKLLFTILFSFSFCFLKGQTVTMKVVKKPEKDTFKIAPLPIENIVNNDVIEPTVVYPEISPAYPGGDDALAEFIAKNLNRKLANERNIYGSVYTSFIVDTAGQVSDIQIKRGIDSVLDAEAIRVVSLFSRWQPGSTRGKVIPVQYYLPIRFVRN